MLAGAGEVRDVNVTCLEKPWIGNSSGMRKISQPSGSSKNTFANMAMQSINKEFSYTSNVNQNLVGTKFNVITTEVGA